MATMTFEVKTYEVKIARQMDAGAGATYIKFPAYIQCNGDEYNLVVYALDDTSQAPDNSYIPAAKHGTILVPRWQFEWFRDLLLNEKPVYCYLNSDIPKYNCLYTGAEPVGHQEL